MPFANFEQLSSQIQMAVRWQQPEPESAPATV